MANALETTRVSVSSTSWTNPLSSPLTGRTNLLLHNVGSVDIYLASSATRGDAGHYKTLEPGTQLNLEANPNTTFVVKAASGTGTLEIIETGVVL